MGNHVRELTGKRFGRLTVLESAGKGTQGNMLWRCLCDCGTEVIALGGRLTGGNKKSCGCLRREVSSRSAIQRLTKHGHASSKGVSRTYTSWQTMLARCLRQQNKAWEDYGGRGITVCERWHEFPEFLRDMGERPDNTTLDRIDPNGNYEPGNCRWAPRSVQALNTRKRWRQAEVDGLISLTREALSLLNEDEKSGLERRLNELLALHSR